MNLYSRKQYTKLALFALASIIVAISLFYSGRIVTKIREEERQKVKLWSEAIQKRAKLVNYTRDLFEKLRIDERKKADLWNSAISYLINAPLNANVNFANDIIADNTTIPVIVVDRSGNVIGSKNLEGDVSDKNYLKNELALMRKANRPLEIQLGEETQLLYYRDSKTFSELKSTMDDLINSFISETVISSASVPVIYTDGSMTNVIAFGNIDSTEIKDPKKLKERIDNMREQNEPLFIKLGDRQASYIFYEDSFLLTQLKYYPYLMLTAIGIFLIVSYVLFSTFRNAEQNQVWVGMAKETAHQLGTPLSSLMAWMDLLRMKNVDEETLGELGKDLARLQTITDRFSKIGSKPEMTEDNVLESVNTIVEYLRPRVSRKVTFEIINDYGSDQPLSMINRPLFEWVIENLCKNAVDAMNGVGDITLTFRNRPGFVCIDVTDTGKGIPKSQHQTVFEPGFTTKKRGWGLGLSLCKRIINNYHKGNIFVKRSEPGKGTTFRIQLKKA
ncbi:MAG: ATP-binding protein [Bacteroidota bacterium]